MLWQPRQKFRDRVWLHVLLLLLTIASTTLVGIDHYLGYQANYLPLTAPAFSPRLVVTGLWYSVTVLAILGCHEMGHYLACRYL